MGSTESKHNHSKLQKQYRLVRRYISDLYANSEVTVIQHKQTQEQFALKELVQQFNPDKLIKELQTHTNLNHPNLIQLKKYWIQNDANICSSLFKVYAIFEYEETTLEQWLNDNTEEINDREIADFVHQVFTALTFLQRNKIFYLLSGPKSIAVSNNNEKDKENRQFQADCKNHPSCKSIPLSENYRNSLIDIHRNHSFANHKEYPNYRISLQRQASNYFQPSSKRIYKIFDPLEGLSSSHSFHNIQHYLQVPIHPNLLASGQHYLLPESLVKQQNILTISLIALSMCENCDILDLDIFHNSRLSMEKFNSKLNSLKNTHPKTAKQLSKSIGPPLSTIHHVRISQGLRIKDISMTQQKRQSQVNLLILQDDKQNQEERPLKQNHKINHNEARTPCKRISLWQG